MGDLPLYDFDRSIGASHSLPHHGILSSSFFCSLAHCSLIIGRLVLFDCIMHTTSSFHHIEIHTIQPDYILDLFVQVYGFQLIGQRQTLSYQQWFLKSAKCQFIISSVDNEFDFNQLNESKSDQDYDILSSILINPLTRNFILKRDTVFNVTLEVKSIRTILDRESNLQVSEYRWKITDCIRIDRDVLALL